MSELNDRQIIQQIQEGRRDALGQLFDRYSQDLYDFLARVLGDRDEAGRTLAEVFARVPTAVTGLPPHEPVPGLLYSLAREAALSTLRQKGWLDALPPTDEPLVPGLSSDIWKAARAMPAFHRAVLVVEELHSLSPTEKARALGVLRTDLSHIVEDARRSFNRQFDLQARAQGRPTSAQIDPERIFGLQRRAPNAEASLFSFLPVLALPDSLQGRIRNTLLGGATEVRRAGISVPPPAAEPPPPTPPTSEESSQPAPVVVEIPAPTQTTQTTTTRTQVRRAIPVGDTFTVPATALAILIGLVLALLLCGLIFYFTRDTTPPSVDRLDPPDGGSVPFAQTITITASFHDDRGIDPTKTKLIADGSDVTDRSIITDNAASYSGPFTLGPHIAQLMLVDRSGNRRDAQWSFVVSVAPPATATPTPTATPTSYLVPTPTPIFYTATFQPPATTVPPPVYTSTPCVVGIFGTTYNDLNGNQVRDQGEPALANVTVTLMNPVGSPLAAAVTDSFGRFFFNNLPNGNYRVSVQAPGGYMPTTPSIFTVTLVGCGAYTAVDFGFIIGTPTATATGIASQTPVVVTATFTPTPSATPTGTTNLSGTVRNSRFGFGLNAVTVSLSAPSGASTLTNGAGQYLLASIQPGVYIVSGGRTAYQGGGGTMTINPGPNLFDFSLLPCVSITAHSLAQPTAVAGQTITLGYTLRNDCGSPIPVWLGATLRQGPRIVVDPAHDASFIVPVLPATLNASRSFTVPSTSLPGAYDVSWTIWESRVGTTLTGKYDETTDSNALTVLLPTPTSTSTSTATRTPTATRTATPTATRTP